MAHRLLLLCLLVVYSARAAPADEPKPYGISAKDDLETASSDALAKRSPEYGGYYGNSGVSGHGIVDGYAGYDNTLGYGASAGPTRGYFGGGYGGGYAPRDYGYGAGVGGYAGGAGGYGGYGGNGGLNSYLGYNNPYYQGASNHLGYGYYNRNLKGYGNIYSNGIAPSLVTGYRGYSRR